MTPGTYNTDMEQGDDWSRTFEFTNKDKTPFTDFTLWTGLTGQMRKLPTDTGTPIAVMTVVPGTLSYQLDVSVARAITAAIPVTKATAADPTITTVYYYDFEGIDPNGKKQTLVKGTITVTPEVTK